MSRIAGRGGRVYLGIASSAADAEPLPFQASWALNFTVNKIDVTAFGDTNNIYVAGLRDASGTFGGFYDDTTQQTYTAASDGLARKFYLYPSTLSTSKYFFGTILVDMSLDSTVAGSVNMSSSWNAASDIFRVLA